MNGREYRSSTRDGEQKNSTRLNYLVCLLQDVDKNTDVIYETRPEKMVKKEFYGYIQFFCVHTFDGVSYMLAYVKYHNGNEHHGLVEDRGPWRTGFADITTLHHLCALASSQQENKQFRRAS